MAPPQSAPRVTDSTFHTSISTSLPIPDARNSTSTLAENRHRRTIIFFISGNPGLIQYYHAFFSGLADELSASTLSASSSAASDQVLSSASAAVTQDAGTHQEQKKDTKDVHPIAEADLQQTDLIHIYGTGLAGFETTTPGSRSTTSTRLYNVNDQIDFVEKRLESLVASVSSTSAPPLASEEEITKTSNIEPDKIKTNVILMGHSVGAYMCMELMRRFREKRSNLSNDADGTDGVDYNLSGSILLFPTVMELAKSDAGVKLTRILRFVPRLHIIAHIAVKILTALLPPVVLRWLVRTVMGRPPPDAVNTTVSFLRSPQGVKQALYMATDELRAITTDKWDDEVWGIASAAPRPSSSIPPSTSSSSQQTVSDTSDGKAVTRQPHKTVFYFGKSDHWVAEKTREDIIRLRGPGTATHGKGNDEKASGKRPKMVVCEEGMPHAFCLRHSAIMAKKTAEFVREILLEEE